MFRLAHFATHPIQYQAPLLRYLDASEDIDLEVFFFSDFSLQEHLDPGYGVQIKWDVPLLEGYKHRFLERLCRGREWKKRPWLPARDLSELLRPERFDAVWVHGWAHACSLQAIVTARRRGIPLLLRGDSCPDSWLKHPPRRWLKRAYLRLLFRFVSGFLCVGRANRQFYFEHNIAQDRLFLTPYAVDNEFFRRKAAQARPHREALRAKLDLEVGRPILLFTGRLAPVKAPSDLLMAYQRAFPVNSPQCPYVLFVGDGPLRPQLETQARALPDRDVRFLGFRHQTELPALYDLCDVFVLPSHFEPWGLVVNEVMNAGRPVIVSDRVGAAPDLVHPGINGWVYPHGDVSALANCLSAALGGADLRAMGRKSLERIAAWDFEADRKGLLEALESVCRRARRVADLAPR